MALAAALLCATPAAAQSSYDWSRAAFYSGVAFDLASTERAIAVGFREANPILSQNRYRRIGISVGSAIAADLATSWLRRNGRPKLATTLNFILGGIRFGAGTYNIHRIRNGIPAH